MSVPAPGITDPFINRMIQANPMYSTVESAKEYCNMGAIALAVTAVAFAALGIICVATASPILAVITIGLASAAAYASYNTFKVDDNFENILANPAQYINVDILNGALTVQKDQILQRLKEDTFYFDWALDKGWEFADPMIPGQIQIDLSQFIPQTV